MTNKSEKEKSNFVKPVLWFIWIAGWLFTSGLTLSSFQVAELSNKILWKLFLTEIIAWPVFLGLFVAGVR